MSEYTWKAYRKLRRHVQDFFICHLNGNHGSSLPFLPFPILCVFPGSSLHYPVQRRQRRGGVHVGVPLPGREASPAGPLTSWPAWMQFHLPPTKEKKILSLWSVSAVWLQWRRRAHFHYPETHNDQPGLSGSFWPRCCSAEPKRSGSLEVNGPWLEPVWSHLCFIVDGPLVNFEAFARVCACFFVPLISFLTSASQEMRTQKTEKIGR